MHCLIGHLLQLMNGAGLTWASVIRNVHQVLEEVGRELVWSKWRNWLWGGGKKWWVGKIGNQEGISWGRGCEVQPPDKTHAFLMRCYPWVEFLVVGSFQAVLLQTKLKGWSPDTIPTLCATFQDLLNILKVYGHQSLVMSGQVGHKHTSPNLATNFQWLLYLTSSPLCWWVYFQGITKVPRRVVQTVGKCAVKSCVHTDILLTLFCTSNNKQIGPLVAPSVFPGVTRGTR